VIGTNTNNALNRFMFENRPEAQPPVEIKHLHVLHNNNIKGCHQLPTGIRLVRIASDEIGKDNISDIGPIRPPNH